MKIVIEKLPQDKNIYLERDGIVLSKVIIVESNKKKTVITCYFRVVGIFHKQYNK